MAPLEARIGIGDSATLRQIGIIDELVRRGTEVVNPFVKDLTDSLEKNNDREIVLRRSLGCDIFLTSTNVITIDGKLVNIDGVGNRIAGIIFGPPKVILAIGRNKIVSDVDQALKRIKNVIAPAHAKHKKKRTPCATTGECVDCDSKERMCSITAIIEKKPLRRDVTVILIDEDLGLGWDVCWPEQRKRMIETEYAKVTWEIISPWHPKTR